MIFNKIKNKIQNKIRKYKGQSATKSLDLYLTRKCNLRCPHCLWLLKDKDFFSKYDMDLEDIKKVLIYFKNNSKIKKIQYAAEGEIFLYDKFGELLKITQDLGFGLSGITTNGLIT